MKGRHDPPPPTGQWILLLCRARLRVGVLNNNQCRGEAYTRALNSEKLLAWLCPVGEETLVTNDRCIMADNIADPPQNCMTLRFRDAGA